MAQFGVSDQHDLDVMGQAGAEGDLADPPDQQPFGHAHRAVQGDPLTRREFKNGTLDNTLEPWSAEVRKVAAGAKVPLVDLNASSAALVQELGAESAMAFAQAPPTADERAAAKAGTTLKARAAEDARLPDVPTTATGPRAQFTRKFDYTHVGDFGAGAFAALVARDLATAVPPLRSQIAP